MNDSRREATKRLSPMLRQKRICNGEKTGQQCQSYWRFTAPPDVDNVHHLKKGETVRMCTLVQIGDKGLLEMGEGGAEMPFECNQYRNSGRPYEPEDMAYDPRTPEEISEDEQSLPEDIVKDLYGEPAFDRTAFDAVAVVSRTAISDADMEIEND